MVSAVCTPSIASSSRIPSNLLRSFATSSSASARYKSAHDPDSGKLKWRMPPRARMAPPTPREFETTITHSNGALITLHTTSPRSHQPLTRDSYNSGLWSFASSLDASAVKEEDESGRLGRFARRFTVADQAGQSPVETPEAVKAREQQQMHPEASATSSETARAKAPPQAQQVAPQNESDFDFSDLLDIGGELQAVDQKQIARPDRSGKKKKGKR